jgi:ankyrin repeat protein
LGGLIACASAQTTASSQENTIDSSELYNEYDAIISFLPDENYPAREQPHLLFAKEDIEKQMTAEVTLIKSKLKSTRFPALHHPGAKESYIEIAIIKNDLENFKYALFQGYDLLKKNKHGKFTFNLAAEHNSFNIIRYVAKVLNINLNQFHTDQLSESMLIKAIDHGHDVLANKILEWGFNIDHLIDNKKTLLHMLAAMPNHPVNMRRLKRLIELGADLDVPDQIGDTPIFTAGKKKQYSCHGNSNG